MNELMRALWATLGAIVGPATSKASVCNIVACCTGDLQEIPNGRACTMGMLQFFSVVRSSLQTWHADSKQGLLN